MNYRLGQRILGNYQFCAVCGEALRKFISSLLMKFWGKTLILKMDEGKNIFHFPGRVFVQILD